ncbi:hypothetical protein FQN57_007320 [Myotisia sp. PD_48]|nr:hypothetical protein FQN57_007320 [Myotisia sp. PD_48]
MVLPKASTSRVSGSKRRSRSLSRTRAGTWSNRHRSVSTSSSFMARLAAGFKFHDGDGRDLIPSTANVNNPNQNSMVPDGMNILSTTTPTGALTTIAMPSSSMPATSSAHPLARHPHLPSPSFVGAQPLSNRLFARESISTASESTDSSPTTTTSSTFDSPVIMETSPSSSPESPSSITPLPYHQPLGHLGKLETRINPLTAEPLRPVSSTVQNFESSTSRPRNLKNLSLKLPQTAFSRIPPPSTAPITESGRHLSAPPSPAHAQTRTSRRRPTNLTIQTPGFDRSASGNILQIVPPTPSIRPFLRHAESSPSLNSILSPSSNRRPSTTFVRSNPAKRPISGIENEPENSERPRPPAATIFTQDEPLADLREEDDNPISRESRKGSERGYPDGPILIYDSGLYLFLEPSREEASKFDVVFNVAKEVNNPFKSSMERQDTVMSVWKAGMGKLRQHSEPATAASEATFMSAFEFIPVESEALATPKVEQLEPEYIHVPWDHNSEILDDLFPLCRMIDDRISKGKSVLIHCQLGVSRSASLVIAYGLYKNPHLDFNSVYALVKGRSCWVGPNMSLIYQLTDFRTKLQDTTSLKTQPQPEWLDMSSAKRDESLLGNGVVQQSQPLGKPQLQDWGTFEPGTTNTKQSVPDLSVLFAFNPFSRTSSSGATRKSPPLRPLPLREKYPTMPAYGRSSSKERMLLSKRSFFRPSLNRDFVMHDAPAEPDLFSPKPTQLIATPFSPSAAGDLAFPPSLSVQSPRSSVLYDPRSPQARKEPLVMRNIDEFL